MTNKSLSVLIAALILTGAGAAAQAQDKRVPTVDDLMMLKSAGSARIEKGGQVSTFDIFGLTDRS